VGVKSYNISEVQSITFGKEHHQQLDMLKILFSPSYFTVYISFADKKALRLTMHKREIDVLLAGVKIQKAEKL
jgi:hypothetical protein